MLDNTNTVILESQLEEAQAKIAKLEGEKEELRAMLQSLWAKTNKVTSAFRHGQTISKKHLTILSNYGITVFDKLMNC